MFESWNRKLHFYLGLYLLLFLWLFAVTGLFLNHPAWEFHQFWSDRKEHTFDRPLHLRADGDRISKARTAMAELGLNGELEWPAPNQPSGEFVFRTVRPGEINDVRVDVLRNVATVKQIKVNTWGVVNMLHTFTGVRMDNPELQRDWLMTKVWSFCMDAVAAGLIFMVLSSYYMWYRLKSKRLLGVLVLGSGFLICGFFVVGLYWIYGSSGLG